MKSNLKVDPFAHQSKEPELHGTNINPRLKWSCKGCGQRNDAAMRIPIATTEVFVCRNCKKASTVDFKPKA